MKVSYNDLNAIFGLDGITNRVVPFHYTHLKIMDIRKADNDLINSFIDYDDRIKTYPVEGLSFSGMCHRDIVCCFGVIPLWEGVYEGWLVPCSNLTKNKFVFHKSSLKFFEYVAEKLNIHRLQINVNSQNCLAYKWAKKCYFIQEGLLREYGPDKSDFYIMSRLFKTKEKE